jgi:thioredoxin reductase (NADPH)
MLVRSNRLSDTISRYLIQRIEENPKIGLRYCTGIVALEGDTQLERVTWRASEGGTRLANHAFWYCELSR